MKQFAVFLFLAFSACFVSAQEAKPSSTQDMTPEQFKAAGLNKLSAAELTQLNNWILGVKTVVVEKIVTKEVEKPAESREAIDSSIVSDFKGWSGGTVFTLENGQVWRQTDGASMYLPKKIKPKVRLEYSGSFGWRMYLVDEHLSVKVARVK